MKHKILSLILALGALLMLCGSKAEAGVSFNVSFGHPFGGFVYHAHHKHCHMPPPRRHPRHCHHYFPLRHHIHAHRHGYRPAHRAHHHAPRHGHGRARR